MQAEKKTSGTTSVNPHCYPAMPIEMHTEVPVSQLARLNQQVGFLEGVLLGLEFATTYDEVRGVLERANKRYEQIKAG